MIFSKKKRSKSKKVAIISQALVGLLGYGKSKNMCDFEKSPSVSGSLDAKKNTN